MRSFVKFALCLLVLGFGSVSVRAFSFYGPKAAYQADDLGYDRLVEIKYPFNTWIVRLNPDFLNSPRNLDEDFRWAVPVIYYAYDPSFVGYFGIRGMAEVDSAVAILNRLTNVSSFSPGLTEFPLDEFRYNYTGNAMKLFDLKSAALEMLVARLGLADPEVSMWGVRGRQLQPGASCPLYDYTIVQRNFDPMTLAPTPYINGALFTYSIFQTCPPSAFGDYSRAQPNRVSGLDTTQTAVASQKTTQPSARYYGLYHVGLTRDDAAALRYLYSKNNLNFETSPGDSLLFETNSTSQVLFTSNLTVLASQALTNPAPALQALYPNLVILGTTNTFTNVTTVTVTPYLTNFPWSLPGQVFLAFATNLTTTFGVPLYHHTFGNLLGFRYVPGSGWQTIPIPDIERATNRNIVTFQTDTLAITNPPFSPVGTFVLQARSSSKPFVTNMVSGEYVILPTNFCSEDIVGVLATNVTPNTNILFALTNTAASTNLTGTNATLLSYTQSQIDYFTNHVFVVLPVGCTTNTSALRRGIEKVSFVRRDFDSLLNRFFLPVTNDYTMTAVTNSTEITQRFRRIVIRPDILFAAADIAIPANVVVETVDHFTSGPTFDTNTVSSSGTIEGPITLTFNKVGPVHFNSATGFLDEQGSIFWYNWASYNGSTNAPYIYPQDISQDISGQLLLNVMPASLPVANFGIPYDAALNASGGLAPYSWTLGPGSPQFPPGLGLTVDPANSALATLNGTPALPGTYSFWIRLTDAANRFIDQFYVVTVNPP